MAVKHERILETVATSEALVHDASEAVEFNVLQIRNSGLPRSNEQATRPAQSAPNFTSAASCPDCGKRGHTRDRCWRNMTCHTCNLQGHIARFCRARTQQQGALRSGSSNVVCFACQGFGHYAAQCVTTSRRPPAARLNGDRAERAQQGATDFNRERVRQAALNENAAGQYPIHPSRM